MENASVGKRRNEMFQYLSEKVPVSQRLFCEATEVALQEALHKMCQDLQSLGVPQQHLSNTPLRFIAALYDMFQGLSQDPAKILQTTMFDYQDEYASMVVSDRIGFTSFCAHHLLPFEGHYRFAYIPCGKIVGLSKVPRFIAALCARPQVQEELTSQIVDTFMQVVAPQGCGTIMSASHGCMSCRGVRIEATTHTTGLRGVFKKPEVKDEFLKGYKYEISR